jgi:hypothetical protein
MNSWNNLTDDEVVTLTLDFGPEISCNKYSISQDTELQKLYEEQLGTLSNKSNFMKRWGKL